MLSSILKNGAAKEVSNKVNVTFYEKYVYNMDVLLLKTGYKMRCEFQLSQLQAKRGMFPEQIGPMRVDR